MRVALSFLTRVPVGEVNEPDYFRALGRQAPLFPLVGAVVGGLVCAVSSLAGLGFGPAVQAAAAVAASLWITGALHLDGLMDTADGVLSYKSRERMLEIMKDSRVGAMGVTVGVLGILLRFALVLDLSPELRWPALLAAPALGRMAVAAAAGLFPPARREGANIGSSFAAHVRAPQVAGALALGLAVALAAGWWAGAAAAALLRGAVAWLLALAVAGLLGRSLTAKLGGLTGDTYGAINEAVELAVLAAFATRWLPW